MSLFIFLQEDKREEIKEWVLALSMDRRVRLCTNTSFDTHHFSFSFFLLGGADLTIR